MTKNELAILANFSSFSAEELKQKYDLRLLIKRKYLELYGYIPRFGLTDDTMMSIIEDLEKPKLNK